MDKQRGKARSPQPGPVLDEATMEAMVEAGEITLAIYPSEAAFGLTDKGRRALAAIEARARAGQAAPNV